MAKKTGYITLNQLREKSFSFIEELPEEVTNTLGRLYWGTLIFVYGNSGNGKSSLIMRLIKMLNPLGVILYVSLEEGQTESALLNFERFFDNDFDGRNIRITGQNMSYDDLRRMLQRRGSPNIVFIDSVQYWKLKFEKYKALTDLFPKKIFVFISHEKSGKPKGDCADSLCYHSTIKMRIKGFIAFITSRAGAGGETIEVYPKGAKAYWGKSYKAALAITGHDTPLPKIVRK